MEAHTCVAGIQCDDALKSFAANTWTVGESNHRYNKDAATHPDSTNHCIVSDPGLYH